MVGVTRIFGVRTQRGLISAVVGTVRISPIRCFDLLLLPDSPRDACTLFTTRPQLLHFHLMEKDSEQSVAKRPCCLCSQASRVYLWCETVRASALELSQLSLNLKPQRFIIIRISFTHLRRAACSCPRPSLTVMASIFSGSPLRWRCSCAFPCSRTIPCWCQSQLRVRLEMGTVRPPRRTTRLT